MSTKLLFFTAVLICVSCFGCSKPDQELLNSDSIVVKEELARQDEKFPIFRSYKTARFLYEFSLAQEAKNKSKDRYNSSNSNNHTDGTVGTDDINKKLDVIEQRIILLQYMLEMKIKYGSAP